jgi:branched-chain amino acid transport system permease protein
MRSSLGVRIACAALAAIAAIAALAADTEAIRALLIGLGSGALIAAIGIGVVLTYRGSGVINFATGAMAMYVCYVFAGLHDDGRLLLGAWTFDVGGPLSLVPALVIALLVGAALGLLLHVAVFRPLGPSPPLAKTVASVGVLLVLQSLVVLGVGSEVRPLDPIFAPVPTHLPGDMVIPRSQLLLAGVVVAAGIVLWAIFRFTTFGLRTRAAAENERGAILLGSSPDALGAASWVLSGLVVGLLGILAGTVNGTLDPNTITLLIVPALGAALLGAFRSFGLTIASGLAIGMTQSLILYLSTKSWFPQAGGSALPGLDQTLPFVVIVVALFLRGSSLPERGSLTTVRLPFAPRPTWLLPRFAICGVVTLVALFVVGPEFRLGIINTLVGIALCLSLVVLTGFVGQVSLAQMALAGVAGFTLAKLVSSYGVPFPIGPLLGALAATALGLLAAVPALRVRGVQLAVVTLAAALAIENMVFKNPSWAGGFEGARVPAPSAFGFGFGPGDTASIGDGKLPSPWFGVFCLLVVLLIAAGVVNLRRSGTGRRMLAVRANERAAAAAGISVSRTKLLAFGISAFVAGLGGALSAYRFGSVTPAYFGSFASMSLLAFAYLGGISSVSGGVVAGLFVTGGLMAVGLDEWLGLSDDYVLLIGGLGLILTVVLNPEGVSGAMRLTYRQVRRRLQAPRAPRPESALPRQEGGSAS